MILLRTFVLCAALLAAGCASTRPGETIVRTQAGFVQGEALDDSTFVFRGIPFAAPPVADLRWRPPQPAPPWSGTRAATEYGPACAQNSFGWNEHDAARGSEDCLYLDVRTPSLEANARLPVLVWIHGGSNRAASGAGKVMSVFPRHGVVMIAVNYRLGAFGFLSHPELSAEQGGASGNYALMDQISALRWVRANIARFGGDPENVTIAGDSAGGQDVNLLLVSLEAHGLFHKAIAQSGSAQFGWPVRSLAENEAIGVHFAERVGASDLAALRVISVEQVLAADLELTSPTIFDPGFVWLQPVIDGRVITQPPHDVLSAGVAENIALLMGSNAEEFGLAGGPERADDVLAMMFGESARRARSFYGLDTETPRYDDVANDMMFRCPVVETARLVSQAGGVAYAYQYARSGEDGAPVRHGSELSVVSNATPVGEGVTLTTYWVNFIRTGDPNSAGLPHWPSFDASDRGYMNFGDEGPSALRDLGGEACPLAPRL